MSNESINEIQKLIFVSFLEQIELSISDLERLWSLELQWMMPEEASLVIKKLIKSGWLVSENNLVSPVYLDKQLSLIHI